MTVIPLGEPGRPRSVAQRRSARVQSRVAAYHESEARFVDADQLVRATKADSDLESLYMARLELAREAASLHFARLQAAPGSREMGRLATRRIAALRQVASLTIAINHAGAASPSPARLRRVLEDLMAVVDQSASSVLPPNSLTKFRAEWQRRGEAILRQMCAQDPDQGAVSPAEKIDK
jgi:hypothetical protein